MVAMDLVAYILTSLKYSTQTGRVQTQLSTMYEENLMSVGGTVEKNYGLGPRNYLIASVADMYPLSMCPSPLPEGQDPGAILMSDCGGVEPKVLRIIAEKMNLTVKFKQLGDGPWGSRMANGSWNGHIGRILRGEADLAIGSITQTFARYRAVDFSHPVAQDYYTFTVPTGEELPKYDAFLRPFTVHIWFYIVFSFIAIALVQTIIDGGAQKDSRPRRQDGVQGNCLVDEERNSTGYNRRTRWSMLPQIFWRALESATWDPNSNQGLFSAEKGRRYGQNSFALLTATYTVVFTVLAQIYSAVILAFLITPSFPVGIETLEDAVLHSQAKFITTRIDGALTEYITQSSSMNGSLFKAINDANRLVVCQTDRLRCSKLEKDFVLSPIYLAERYKANYSSQGRKLSLAHERLLVSSFAWPIRRGNPLIPKLNNYLVHAEAGGIIQELFRRERRNYVNIYPPINAEAAAAMAGANVGAVRATSGQPMGQGLRLDAVETLSFEEFQGGFVIYGVGVGLAFTAFMFEVLLSALGRRN